MGTWTDRITNHRVHASLEAFGEALENARTLSFEDETHQEGLIRLSAAMGYIQTVLEGLNPYLTLPATLDEIANRLDLMASELVAFVAEKSATRSVNANSHLDVLLEIIYKLLPKSPKAVFRDLPKVIQDVTSQVRDHKAFLKEQKGKFVAATEAHEAELKSLKDSIEADLEVLRASHSTALSDLSGATDAATEAADEQWRALESKLNELMKAKEDVIEARLATAQASMDARMQSLEAEATTRVTAMVDLVTNLQTESVKKFSALEAEVVKIVGATGNAAMAGQFHQIGTAEETKAEQFQKWANWTWLGFALIGIGIMTEALVHQWMGRPAFTNGWASFGTRAFLSLSIAALGGYMMRQADRHRAVARWGKRLAAEISSMGAFLTPLDPEQQKAVRAAVALRIFGQAAADAPPEKHVDDSHSLPSIDGLSKLLGQVLNAAKDAR